MFLMRFLRWDSKGMITSRFRSLRRRCLWRCSRKEKWVVSRLSSMCRCIGLKQRNLRCCLWMWDRMLLSRYFDHRCHRRSTLHRLSRNSNRWIGRCSSRVVAFWACLLLEFARRRRRASHLGSSRSMNWMQCFELREARRSSLKRLHHLGVIGFLWITSYCSLLTRRNRLRGDLRSISHCSQRLKRSFVRLSRRISLSLQWLKRFG